MFQFENTFVKGRFDPTAQPKQYYFGTFFLQGTHQKWNELLEEVSVQGARDSCYLAQIFLTSVEPYGGDFDEDDRIQAEVYNVDGSSPSAHPVGNNFLNGVYIGPIQQNIQFRLYIKGDNYVGASYLVMELGRCGPSGEDQPRETGNGGDVSDESEGDRQIQ